MPIVTQSINIAFTTTSSVPFTRPVQQITLLDSTNIQFLRQLMLSSDGVKVIRGNYSIQIPTNQLFAAAFAAFPSMSWSPILTGPTSSINVDTSSAPTSTASMAVTASDEFGNDMTYQWYVSSSYTSGWGLPTGSAYGSYQGTSSANLIASYISGANPVSPFYYYCGVTNPAGTTPSSTCTVNLGV